MVVILCGQSPWQSHSATLGQDVFVQSQLQSTSPVIQDYMRIFGKIKIAAPCIQYSKYGTMVELDTAGQS